MLSTVFASPIRRLLLVMMGVSCFFALRTQAQTVPDPCGTATAPEAAAASDPRPVELATYLCGGAGQRCCPYNTCNSGLVCNSNGICRTPCGGFGQACCSGVCYGGELICSFSTNTCIACGRLFEPCCAGNKCAAGTCNGSTCQ